MENNQWLGTKGPSDLITGPRIADLRKGSDPLISFNYINKKSLLCRTTPRRTGMKEKRTNFWVLGQPLFTNMKHGI